MSIALLISSLVDAPSVSADASEAGYPASRVHDGEQGTQWMGPTAGTRYITVDYGAARTVSAWGLAHHNATAVQLYSSADGVSYTLRDTAAPTSASAYAHALSSALSARYWQVAINAGAGAPAVGELLLGEAFQLPTPQIEPGHVVAHVGNVRRDRSPAGYSWAVKRGPQLRRFQLGWNALSDADVQLLRDAWTACEEGLLKLVYVDADGAYWWVEWVDAELEISLSQAVFDGLLGRAASITLHEAL